MGYFIVVNGFEIHCDTVNDALALARGAKSSNGGAAAPGTEGTRRQRKPLDHALAFLEALRSAGEKGIGGDELRKKIGLQSTAGLGTLVQNIRRFLKESTLSFDAIAQKARRGDAKLWFAGPSIEDGIIAIKNKLNELFPAPAGR